MELTCTSAVHLKSYKTLKKYFVDLSIYEERILLNIIDIGTERPETAVLIPPWSDFQKEASKNQWNLYHKMLSLKIKPLFILSASSKLFHANQTDFQILSDS